MVNSLEGDFTKIANGQESKSLQQKTSKKSVFWVDRRKNPLAFGCLTCPQLTVCGGLYVEKSVYDCLDYCCGSWTSCDIVCRKNPEVFVKRIREIGGFELDDIRRSRRKSIKPLPIVVPVLFNGASRNKKFDVSVVSLPFSTILDRKTGGLRFQSSDHIAEHFKFSQCARLLLTGTEKDAPLERWWKLSERRVEVIQDLSKLGVELITTPNFSLIMNRPRWDDLHSIKRIGLAHEEFLSAGLRAALHINARTERDWERWTDYIANREEIQDISFEFTTGAGRCGRKEWHVNKLCELARNVGHKLHLTVRAAPVDILRRLNTVYAGVTYLDTNTFMKTVKRQRAIRCSGDEVDWIAHPTTKNEGLDNLLQENWRVVRNHLTTSI